MSDDPYVYPGSSVLKNSFDVRDASELARLERRWTGIRSKAGAPGGNFDRAHLRAIHRHLTQLLYLKRLAERAGHRIDLTQLRRTSWIEASRPSHRGDDDPMARAIGAALRGQD